MLQHFAISYKSQAGTAAAVSEVEAERLAYEQGFDTITWASSQGFLGPCRCQGPAMVLGVKRRLRTLLTYEGLRQKQEGVQ